MINVAIFCQITKELASWITIWRFLRGLDRYAWNAFGDSDGPADARKNAEIKKREFKTARHGLPVMADALANKVRSDSVEKAIVMDLAVHKPH